jgi:hypothetical protein
MSSFLLASLIPGKAGKNAVMVQGENAFLRLSPKIMSLYLPGPFRRSWKDDSKTVLKGTECEDWYWINVAQDSVRWRACVNSATNFPVSIKGG